MEIEKEHSTCRACDRSVEKACANVWSSFNKTHYEHFFPTDTKVLKYISQVDE